MINKEKKSKINNVSLTKMSEIFNRKNKWKKRPKEKFNINVNKEKEKALKSKGKEIKKVKDSNKIKEKKPCQYNSHQTECKNLKIMPKE